MHCLLGLEYAILLKWFDVKNFNLRDYEFYERVENGDLNWIIPNKFIAFSGPQNNKYDNEGVAIDTLLILIYLVSHFHARRLCANIQAIRSKYGCETE